MNNGSSSPKNMVMAWVDAPAKSYRIFNWLPKQVIKIHQTWQIPSLKDLPTSNCHFCRRGCQGFPSLITNCWEAQNFCNSRPTGLVDRILFKVVPIMIGKRATTDLIMFFWGTMALNNWTMQICELNLAGLGTTVTDHQWQWAVPFWLVSSRCTSWFIGLRMMGVVIPTRCMVVCPPQT